MLQFSDKFLEHIDDNKRDSVTKFFTGLPSHAVFMWMVTFTTCILPKSKLLSPGGGGRVVRRCWVNFQCRGVLLIWIIVGQGPIALAVGAGGGCLDIFFSIYHFSFLSPSLWETARYRLKYCLKGP